MGLTDRSAFYYSGFLLSQVHHKNPEAEAPVKEPILAISLWNQSDGVGFLVWGMGYGV
ncbi:hypothetical protein [Limnofasciculus baicalensis]|uniref:Uncharacterized protein n=1 Tax=Limnofasciculus baicalensis BBK-W-15 TaxID=2699891 RepID=A0AAE3GXG3_9CYAN|nr:hypothetical protein [Limnofasciculus baicalensis]MCP2732395.1 hypothetical protein [Limnofasciculus baicalensis BBK-W-15]